MARVPLHAWTSRNSVQRLLGRFRAPFCGPTQPCPMHARAPFSSIPQFTAFRDFSAFPFSCFMGTCVFFFCHLPLLYPCFYSVLICIVLCPHALLSCPFLESLHSSIFKPVCSFALWVTVPFIFSFFSLCLHLGVSICLVLCLHPLRSPPLSDSVHASIFQAFRSLALMGHCVSFCLASLFWQF